MSRLVTSLYMIIDIPRIHPHIQTVTGLLRKAHPNLKVTAVRNPAPVNAVRCLGIEVVQGSFSDTNLITLRVRLSDITINISSDDVELLKRRA